MWRNRLICQTDLRYIMLYTLFVFLSVASSYVEFLLLENFFYQDDVEDMKRLLRLAGRPPDLGEVRAQVPVEEPRPAVRAGPVPACHAVSHVELDYSIFDVVAAFNKILMK